jgi:hypothetical protein
MILPNAGNLIAYGGTGARAMMWSADITTDTSGLERDTAG